MTQAAQGTGDWLSGGRILVSACLNRLPTMRTPAAGTEPRLRSRQLATGMALLLILALAAYLRLYNLIPVHKGLQALQDYDEAVWDSTAQLMLQGHLPYRDFFTTLPPVGIYLLAGVLRLVYVRWGSGLGLMATRYASVAYGLAAIALVYWMGRRLGGRLTGITAAGMLALDGMVIGLDRQAMLEPPLNLFSMLAALSYLFAFERAKDDVRGQWLAAMAGAWAAMASLAKTPGMVMILALLTLSLLRGRPREALLTSGAFALTWLVLSAYFLVQCPADFLKQVYFFQLLRPADGVVRRLPRLYDMWHYVQAWLTVRTGVLGSLLISLSALWPASTKAVRQWQATPWGIVVAWATYTLALIMLNSSYYPQYYAQLAVPLCLLGGGLLDTRLWPAGLRRGAEKHVSGLTMGRMAFVAILVVGLVGGQLVRQHTEIARLLGQTESTYTKMANHIQDSSSPGARILVFEPNYSFLASRPPAGAQPGQFLVDSYGEMLYVNLGIHERSILALTQALLTGKRAELQPTFWDSPAQQRVLAAFDQAEYVVIDGRARYQLSPQTLDSIQARSTEVFEAGVASLRRRG